MLTETLQTLNLSHDFSKETLSGLVRKNVAEFSDKFFHFQYKTLEMFKGALNIYIMLKLLFNKHPPFCNVLKNVSHQYYATNQDTKPHILLQNWPQIGVEQCLAFLFATASFIMQPFFLRKVN